MLKYYQSSYEVKYGVFDDLMIYLWFLLWAAKDPEELLVLITKVSSPYQLHVNCGSWLPYHAYGIRGGSIKKKKISRKYQQEDNIDKSILFKKPDFKNAAEVWVYHEFFFIFGNFCKIFFFFLHDLPRMPYMLYHIKRLS